MKKKQVKKPVCYPPSPQAKKKKCKSNRKRSFLLLNDLIFKLIISPGSQSLILKLPSKCIIYNQQNVQDKYNKKRATGNWGTYGKKKVYDDV